MGGMTNAAPVRDPANEIVVGIRRFRTAHARELEVGGQRWRYYRLGSGPALVWLTGGLRRAALGYGFLELLAHRYTILAPDYPPLDTFAAFDTGLSAILDAEDVGRYHLVGQSYGGLLAQAYLARRPRDVDRLVLSSSGPADYGRAWLPVEYAAIALVRLLPVPVLKRLLTTGLGTVVTTEPAQRADWLAALRDTVEHDLTRADLVSHFAVAADIIGTGLVHPGAFAPWPGRVVMLSALNDPTQSGRDVAGYARLFARPVRVISMGHAGHTAALADPPRYAAWLDQALS
jgi:pimeloyl-ACP methyl ester carboxylesterase